ncbi:auxin-induced protein 15A [Rhodamnia argentea]|uniref:Auxin-induced protein 15A n=1 Tax=Rhodamnia argentea TaxID=178133 RepID=A0ABM3H1U8_9MYRT|nr:auxin-induced protein 15A [Rhodamnia argentea]
MVSSIVKKLRCCGATTPDAPKGRVPIRVGRHGDLLCKFDVEASHLSHPLFQDLLRSSEEEFGFSYDGALRIPCEVGVFRCLLRLLNASHRGSRVRAPKLSAEDGRSKCFLLSR